MTADDVEKPIWYKSLRMRLAAMMSLALLPIGLIAILQTNSVSVIARENAELALLGLTESAALNERLVIQNAFGAAAVLASEVPDIADDTERCSRAFKRFVTASDVFSFAGFLPTSGLVTCSSSDRTFDFSNDPTFAQGMAERTRRVEVNAAAPLSDTSVVIVAEPVFDKGEFLGYVTVSIPHAAINQVSGSEHIAALVDIITFNDSGTMLTSQLGLEDAQKNLPAGGDLKRFATVSSLSFSQSSIMGENLIYTIVPVEFGKMYVLGIWNSKVGVSQQFSRVVPTSFFPVLMSIISLGVALMAVHRLVIRHIQKLGTHMAQFAVNRRLVDENLAEDMPTELRNIHDTFTQMAQSILRDEAVIEDAARHKSVLLKEVHHRVKNNLQLISSILNMQIRAAKNPDTKSVLRRMQDRVLSLATIHGDLYQTTDAGSVDVGKLVREIVDKSVEIGAENAGSVDVSTDIEPVLLFPDQAVPMSLLASEAATNAMKYAGIGGVKSTWIKVTFTCDSDRNCVFEMRNSKGVSFDVESTGMGSKLISAFATQLGAEVQIDDAADAYTLTVRFLASEFDLEPGNF